MPRATQTTAIERQPGYLALAPPEASSACAGRCTFASVALTVMSPLSNRRLQKRVLLTFTLPPAGALSQSAQGGVVCLSDWRSTATYFQRREGGRTNKNLGCK